MKERVNVRLPKQFREITEEKESDASEWIKQAIKLGLFVEAGKVFREIGDQYEILSMRDIKPYPTTYWFELKERRERFEIQIPQELVTEIEKNSPFRISEWINRAIKLRRMAENLDLFERKGDEFVQISFKKE